MSMIDHDHQDELRARGAAERDARRYRRNSTGVIYRVQSEALGPNAPYVLAPNDGRGTTLHVTPGDLARDFTRCDAGVSLVGSPAAPGIPTPAELRARVEVVDRAAIDALAATVAKALESQWSPGGRVVVDVTQSQRVVDAVAAILRAAGWVVSYSSDQRDGRTLAITAPAPLP